MDNSISKSGLDKIDISPLDYWYTYLSPDREPYAPSKQVIFDEALRCAILDFAGFNAKHVKLPASKKTTTIGKSEHADVERLAASMGHTVLTDHEYHSILKMREAVLNHKACKMLLVGGVIGYPLRYAHPTGAEIRLAPHYINDGLLFSIQSTTDPGIENFQKECWNLKHHKKAAIQIDAFLADGIVFINVENKPPYRVSAYPIEQRAIDLGRETYVRNCETFVKCLQNNEWPGLPETLQEAGLPEWAYRIEESRRV